MKVIGSDVRSEMVTAAMVAAAPMTVPLPPMAAESESARSAVLGAGFPAVTGVTSGESQRATGDIFAFDFSGRRVWARNLGVPENVYGHSSSLLIHRDILRVQYDNSTASLILGLSTATGGTC